MSDINFRQRYLVIMVFISPFFTLHVYGQLTQPKYGGYFHAPILNNQQWFFSQTKVLNPLSSPKGKAAIEIYLDKDIDNDGLPDFGAPFYLRNNFRYVQTRPNDVRLALISVKMESYQGTSVEYFMPDDNIVKIYDAKLNSQYSITDQNLWYRLSKVAPFQTVRAIESLPILFEIPKSKRKEDAVFQVKYFTRYRGFDKFDFSKVIDYRVYPCEWGDHDGLPLSSVWWLNKANDNILGPEFPNDYIKSTEPVSSPQIVWRDEELTNESSVAEYRFSWCGDGVLNQSETFSNGTFSEECDPADPLKRNWGVNGCDCNCKKTSNKPKVWAVIVGVSDYAEDLN